MHEMYSETTDRPLHGELCPYSFRQVCGSPADHVTQKMQETGPTVYSPYPRRLECLTICRYNYKGSTFSSFIFKTLSVGPVWGSNPRPPAQQTGALPTELAMKHSPVVNDHLQMPSMYISQGSTVFLAK